jgi:hypothetical protein
MSDEEQAKFLNDRIVKLCTKNTWISKWRLNKIVKNNLSPADYKFIGKKVTDAIIKTGKDLEYQECYALLGESKNV